MQTFCTHACYSGLKRGGEEMGASERRIAIWRVLCTRRQDTIVHVAYEFHVSRRTMYYDVQHLSLIYPLEFVHDRFKGGVKIADGYVPKFHAFSPAQLKLLLKLLSSLTGSDAIILSSIIHPFSDD